MAVYISITSVVLVLAIGLAAEDRHTFCLFFKVIGKNITVLKVYSCFRFTNIAKIFCGGLVHIFLKIVAAGLVGRNIHLSTVALIVSSAARSAVNNLFAGFISLLSFLKRINDLDLTSFNVGVAEVDIPLVTL